MPKRKSTEAVLALDLGTSSVRAVVYDTRGRMVEQTLCDLPYKVQTKEPGEVSSDPPALLKLIEQSIDQALKAARKQKVTIVAAAASCYWHSLMGIDGQGKPTTELLTWADTRSAAEAEHLRATEDERDYHARTGCFFHASYWPAKLRWLASTRSTALRRTARWVSLAEYLYRELFGEAPVSLSIASGTGLLDVNRREWDPQALRLAGITPNKLSRLTDWDEPCHSLRAKFARRWPELRGIPWYLPVGDGALANVGAGTVTPQWACATIGTSSALRVILASDRLDIPWGTFVYRLDRQRFVVGGALSEGGNVVRWFTAGLGLGHKKQLEREAGAIAPDSHGLTVLPFWAGERSPNWR
ncbi:MAG TPA: gluconokinase, partial [Candidatus Dormibacteraeota bacterium]|nr:gluconokinase [Candidatus Dormibacteraeota bacterium]